MKIQILSGLAVLLLALTVGVATAGNTDRIGTAGAQELTISSSARGMALGDGVVADDGGLDMLFYNPASVASVRTVEAYFTNLSYIADMQKSHVSVGVSTGYGTIAVAADVFSIGDIIETTEDNPDGTGRIFSPEFSVLSVAYGRYMTDQVRVGATAKLVNESIADANATGVAFDVGILYRPGPRGVSFGLAVKNFGPNMRYSGSDFESFHRTADNPQADDRALASQSASFELPSYFEMGVRYGREIGAAGSLAGYGTFQSDNFNYDEYKLAVEYGWKETVYLRGGGTLTQGDDYLFGPAFGIGLAVPVGGQSRVYADYTVRTVSDYFDDNHMFAVKFEF
jgi:hypothetical protein